jgi:Cdc6-like AAA superfamily ATPase
MIRQRIPVNLLNYRPTLLGIEIWRLLSLFMLAVISFLLYRITGDTVSLFVMAPIILIALKYRNSTMLEVILGWITHIIEKKTVENRLTVRIIGHGGTTAFNISNKVFTITEIEGLHILEMRNGEQFRIYSSLEKIINNVDVKLSFLTMSISGPRESLQNGQQRIRNFVIVQDQASSQSGFDSGIASLTEKIRDGMDSIGIAVRDGGIPDLLEILAESGYVASPNSEVPESGTVHSLELISLIHRYRHFSKATRYYADMVLKDSNYEFGPSYIEILRSMYLDFSVTVSLKNMDMTQSSEYLKRIIAERSAEMRSAGSSYTNSGNRLRLQVQDGKHMLDLLGSNNIRPTTAAVTLRIFADHPAILKDNISRVDSALKKSGLEFVPVGAEGRSAGESILFGTSSHVGNYLMNTRSVSSMLPFLSAGSTHRYGIMLGYDDLNEQPVYLDFFMGPSHNSIILGETGSGKSFFAKYIISRYLEQRNDLSIIIFDPLEEYDCSLFRAACSVINVNGMKDVAHLRETIAAVDRNASDSGERSRIIVVRPGTVHDETWDARLQEILNTIMNATDILQGNKIVILDESHLFLKNRANMQVLDSLVRHSRHSGTAVISISQNVTDFLANESRSIIYNSANIFLFRTRSLTESFVEALKLDDFDNAPPETLAGGKGYSYSECIFSDGHYARKLRIIPDAGENYPT